MKGLITNQWDRDNLNFLLNTNDECLKDWHAQADADDLAYAQELLAAFSLELRVKAEELRIECKLETLSKYNEAKSLLDTIAKRR
jgi:hypothetical protein